MQGWWYYYPVALAVKTSIPLLILAAWGAGICSRRFAAAAYRLPLAFALGIMLPAMAGSVDIGVRLILPIYIALAILAAIAVASSPAPWRCVLSTALLLWLMVAGIHCHPAYLSYFNAFAGRDPSKILVDSNLD